MSAGSHKAAYTKLKQNQSFPEKQEDRDDFRGAAGPAELPKRPWQPMLRTTSAVPLVRFHL